MKLKIVLGILCIFIALLPAYAQEESYIVKFNDSFQLFGEGETINAPYRNFCSVSREELTKLLDMGVVEYYEPDYEVVLFEDYNATDVESQWNLSAINIGKAWDIGCYGNNIRVAVIDSGVYAHPDLKGNLISGYNYIKNSTDTSDNIGHGTYVSGIIAAESNGEYITGIAPKVKIVPLKCFDANDRTTTSMIANAIYDAVDVYGCDIINMSFGTTGSNTTLKLSVEYAIQKGCIIVASVGNDGSTKEYYPAKYDNVIGVGATDEDNVISWFSQRNNTVDVVAPGENVKSVSIEGYGKSSGTSFSCPHVSAVAAIAKCIDKQTKQMRKSLCSL